MKQIQPVFGKVHDPQALAEVLGLNISNIDGRFPIQEVSTGLPFFIVPLRDIATLKKAKANPEKYFSLIEHTEAKGILVFGRFPIQEVSTGLPFFIVPLRDIAALKKAKANPEKYFSLIEHTEAKGILVFCPETHEQGNDISVRVFVDYYGVPEDPATGSANGCLAGYLAKHRYFGQDKINLRAEQGYEIGRPSLILLRAEKQAEGIDVYVGGKAVIVARGDLL